ncbi:malignant T cell amplified sequence 1 [Ochromonadaceae sp. CCMP2298]|jgi:PUA domain protein|nr:malignant T cell amplified sequence 1 [Ochromonadaceae sp. CCMP2298]KAJ1443781.1 malignant T cell amplified sequence 1 [Ochromonadaceae sp. CCMP2298]|mmetsp:Transcript_10464/g.23217  ORF Transcript_10464/g.23217 Transcript_10464/m.23217 type:complete len:181 (+) Transcript_10464:126-668(+)|eukprot:CAMPEP_0173247200 /NCGR_PEP_ID=MMETSP1142-20121109/17764_1 /TAXON_ID=483371 /ORGANISM="non described non described, Strain CCMP2298" /LENGTH=180 /DNA_ID=CAMNT_0014179555 /DNA_START=107 /DNA_END=645 /DNA_ORIENTATION=-
MFKKFSPEESLSSTSQVKNSVQRSIISQITEQFPLIADAIDSILPKKAMVIAKGQENLQMIVVNDEILFYNQKDGPFFPTLKLVHKYPTMIARMQVDKGAIRFVLAGANIMCPGFTSPGGGLPVDIDAQQPVAIYAEGKEHAMAIGLTQMSTTDIKGINKGIAVDNIHYLMDGLWQNPSL